MKRTLALVVLIALAASPAFAARYYVDTNVASPGNGSSWQTAFRSLSTALTRVSSSDEIWVAAGTYTGGFSIPSNVTLLGGFRAGQGIAANRQPLLHRTILDGGGTRRVLTLRLASVVDGFIVQNGSAASPGGGGALCNGTSAIIRNCVFANNKNTGGRGSALAVTNSARPIVQNCVFTQNKGSGNAVDLDNAGGTYMHLTVHNNSASGFHYQNGSNPRIYNSAFTSNSAYGISDASTNNSAFIENNNLNGNSSGHYYYRGQTFSSAASMNGLAHCKANIDGAPGYVSPANWDFGLSATSPLIDKGQFATNFPMTDLTLAPRGYDDPRYSGPAGAYDIGAVAWQGIRITPNGTPGPGSTVTLNLLAPNDSGRSYQVATALDTGIIPIDTRKLKLAFDGLFFATALNQLPAVFAQYVGQLDNAGVGTARINIPNFGVLRGVALHTAFLTVNAGSPSGIARISAPVVLVIN